MINYYELLNIEQDATEAEIKKAVRQQRAKYRRRVDSSPDIDTRSVAEKKIDQIGEAEKVLLDPDQRQSYDQRLESAPSETTSDMPNNSGGQDWISAAWSYYRNGDSRKAYSAAKEATEVDRNNPLAWRVRALMADEMENPDDAEFSIDQALRLAPDDPNVHALAASISSDHEDYKNAENEYRVAIRLDPSDYISAVQLGWMIAIQGREQEAVDWLRELHQEHPDVETINDGFVSLSLVAMETKCSKSLGKFPTDNVPTNEKQVEIAQKFIEELSSVSPINESVHEKLQSYKEVIEYAGRRNFEKSKIGTGIGMIVFWFVVILILGWLFDGFMNFLVDIVATAIFAFVVYTTVMPYGWEVYKETVGEYASKTGAQ